MNLGKETILHIQVADWLRKCTHIPFYHFVNEGVRGFVNAKLLQKMGMTAGVSDLFMPRSNENYYGLWIELKIKPNKPTKKQIEFMNLMLNEGYDCAVCYTFEEAVSIIKKFYSLP